MKFVVLIGVLLILTIVATDAQRKCSFAVSKKIPPYKVCAKNKAGKHAVFLSYSLLSQHNAQFPNDQYSFVNWGPCPDITSDEDCSDDVMSKSTKPCVRQRRPRKNINKDSETDETYTKYRKYRNCDNDSSEQKFQKTSSIKRIRTKPNKNYKTANGNNSRKNEPQCDKKGKNNKKRNYGENKTKCINQKSLNNRYRKKYVLENNEKILYY